ncbi:1,6-anhydro-N-acetylmuramyl-L-alanine amidase AmpD [Candidatus Nitrosacidococcus sp. I8]|uniref:1,6-anhydro-N-acetylmuramyl-L-alanine amidase AmpD n=1 Tax=Candidatus Nitrosacidococcus sp. I8 TaxID=2942908 RepID=UPI0022266DE7|nr:1,6-anhydro-N-acetylmuramyl-L-alanine amidase AmpD [Candidatus Nitrosacidococcus sp. I8]CAH9018244.1 1,6-anhydro-N-acetylmuramyl-L-alanine amidase AmpD [Candidatus Nitrosacidococcus sp. I8]
MIVSLIPLNKFSIDSQGWLAHIRHLISPNYDERPADTIVDWLVIHCISLPPGTYGDSWIDRLFTNTLDSNAHPYFQEIHHLKVSAHALITRQGLLTQYVSFHKRAWHAGVSSLQGRTNCNDFTIGIELEGTDTTLYEQIQYQTLAQLIQALIVTYPSLSIDRIVGHEQIAPGRKTDPGVGFDWGYLKKLLADK